MAELINVSQERIDALRASVNGRVRFDSPDWRRRVDEATFTGAGVFLQRELEHVLAEVLRVQVAPRDYLRAFRLNRSVPAGAQYYTQRYEESFGKASWVTRDSKDVARVGLKRTEKPFAIKMMGVAIQYTMEEMQSAALANVPLDASYGEAARIADDTLHNEVAWHGDATVGLLGLKTAGVGQVTEGALAITRANAEAWVQRLSKSVIRVISDSMGQVQSCRVLMSPRLQIRLMQVSYGTASDVSIYDFWLKSMGNRVESVVTCQDCESWEVAEDGSKRDAIVVFPVEAVEYVAPMLQTALPPQMDGLSTVIYLVSKSGGLYVKYPKYCEIVTMPAIAAT